MSVSGLDQDFIQILHELDRVSPMLIGLAAAIVTDTCGMQGWDHREP